MKRSFSVLLLALMVSFGGAGSSNVLIPPGYWELLSRSGFEGFQTDNFISERNEKAGYLLLALIGNARLEAKRLIFRADRLVFIYYEKDAELGVPHPFEIYAEGNVVVTPGKKYPYRVQVFLSADALYYDGRTLQGLAVNVTGHADEITTLTGPEVPGELGLVAQELRFRATIRPVRAKTRRAAVRFHYFEGRNITVSTCDLALPHWGLRCGEVKVRREEGPAEEYTFTTSRTYLELGGRRVLPLPPAVLSTRFFQSVPLRRIHVVNSRKYGYGLRTTWSANRIPGTGYLLKAFSRATKVPAEVELQVDPLSKRGVGLGATVQYGRSPENWQPDSWQNVRGDLRSWWIHDTGTDRNQRELFPGHPPETWRTTDRYRVRYFHRMSMPSVGTLSAELSLWRDRNFYKEFFENELYRERNPQNPETYVLFRRPLSNDLLLSVLFRPRVNNFQNYTERLPEATVELFPKRLTRTVGPTVEGELQAVNLRFQPDTFQQESLRSFRTGRYHAEGTAALPLGLGRYLRVRPSYEIAGTIYERRFQRHGSGERLVQKAQVTVSTQLWRNFLLPSAFLGTQVLRHVIVPSVSYTDAFFSNYDHSRFYQFDAIDALDKVKYLELALGTYLLGLRRAMTPEEQGALRRLIELRARVLYFPKPGRDNLLGQEKTVPGKWSNLMLEGFSDILQPYLQAGVEAEFDLNRGNGFLILDPYLTLRWPGRFLLNLGNLSVAKDRLRGLSRSNYFWANAFWFVSDRYFAEAYFRYDFANKEVAEQYYGIARRFHCVTVEAGLEVDEGDNEVRWTLRAYPTGMRRRAQP